ncbi:rho GTPase-activating protein 6-like isoform X2 [Apium graveolens]|uniref:rho GTPase-activating protein 6-like isoform X2 n=1 Tax=Apium graveolens TaxID=4045 RepID=UPI003D7BC87D
MGHNGIYRNDANDIMEGSSNQWRERRPVKSLVVGRPILLALEDIDGGSSFLEKALQFLEKYGTKVEGILRQAADVEEMDHRVQEYEQGKVNFGEDEDAHVIGDCVKLHMCLGQPFVFCSSWNGHLVLHVEFILSVHKR